jgi:Uma2 family endonuclease
MSTVPSNSDAPSQLRGLVLAHRSTSAPAISLDAPPFRGLVITPGDASGGELVIPASALTHPGFREWALSDEFPKRGNIAFIDGELIVDMSPESLEEHSAIKSEIARVLLNLVRDRSLGMVHIDGVLISKPEANLSNEPDALFVSRQTLRSGRLQFTPAKGRPKSTVEVVGAVDWVLEIVSPSSRRKDYTLLKETYFKAGIPEYWIVDAMVDDEEEIRFDVLVAADSGYLPVAPVESWRPSPTFGCSFKLAREIDVDGLWQYTLEMKDTV